MRIPFSRATVTHVAVVTSLGLSATALAWAQIGGTEIVSACLSPSGAIRGIGEGESCRNGDAALSWYTQAGADGAFVRKGGPAGGDLAGNYPNPILAAGTLDWSRITNIPAAFADGVDDVGNIDASEPWHEVNAPGEPAFGTGWVNQNDTEGFWATAAFYKDVVGIVRFRGAVRATTDTFEPIFVLPAGYRPVKPTLQVVFASYPA